MLFERNEKFPEGESLDDLRDRAERAMDELVMSYVWEEAKSKARGEATGDIHLAVVSHGLCISELVAALMRKNTGPRAQGNVGDKWTGLLNTAWTRVVINVDVRNHICVLHLSSSLLTSTQSPTETIDPANPPRLKVEVTHVNSHDHLDQVVRQSSTSLHTYLTLFAV